mmetsp:Transcript_13437/g.28502  ORF Transcript_13437/g.28502 Transcript_13437/m.28502 type:complete len:640 (+) Transcript_13437:161-2080(+)
MGFFRKKSRKQGQGGQEENSPSPNYEASDPQIVTASVSAAPASATAPAVQAMAYVPEAVASAVPHRRSTIHAPPLEISTVDRPQPPRAQSTQSVVSSGYNTDKNTFWECSFCTFPNLRTDRTCKGCSSPIPPMLYVDTTPSLQVFQNRPQDNLGMQQITSMGGAQSRPAAMGMEAVAPPGTSGSSSGIMRVHVPNGMLPGQKIKVRSPNGEAIVKTIPPQSEWDYEGYKPFFRMQFGGPTLEIVIEDIYMDDITSSFANNILPNKHTLTWREFHASTGSTFCRPSPSLVPRSVPHSPRGTAGVSPNGRHKALIIGINYTNTRAELKGCINDATNMENLLRRNGFPDDGSHMLLLTDDAQRGYQFQPTRQNLLKAFDWFLKDVRKGDVLFFHFSGHGAQQLDKTGHESDGYNETLMPMDFEQYGHITDDVLWESLIYQLPEGARLTALMDMCHSGTGLDLPYNYNVTNRQWKEDVNPAHSCGDAVLFSGCEDSQTSADVSGGSSKIGKAQQPGGAMTQAFIRAFERTCMATYHEFLSTIKDQLDSKKLKQLPQLTSSQPFDAESRILSLGAQDGVGGIPSTIEPNHNPLVGRQKNRHVRPGSMDVVGFQFPKTEKELPFDRFRTRDDGALMASFPKSGGS